MQDFRNKYNSYIITLFIILQVVFLAPQGQTHTQYSDNKLFGMYKNLVIKDSVELTVDNLSKKELRKIRKAEARRLKKEVRAQKRIDRKSRRLEKKISRQQKKDEKIAAKKGVSKQEAILMGGDSTSISVDSVKKSVVENKINLADSLVSSLGEVIDSIMTKTSADSLLDVNRADSIANDLEKNKKRPQYLSEIIHSTNKDSMVFDVRNNNMYIYEKGELTYGENVLNADYMRVRLLINQIDAKGALDSAGVLTEPSFSDGATTYNMDSMSYNLKTQKANVRNAHFKEGEGFMQGEKIKKMDNDMINIKNAKYTTCDCPEPHFYLHSNRAQIVEGKNNKNIIIGLSYLVLEGVPLPLIIPGGFFPLMSDRNSGWIIPEFGEESQKGFFLRGGGYYFAFNDYFDATIRGGIYTLGSWELSAMSTYKKKYKFSGNLGITYSKDIIGQKGSSDYRNQNNYRVNWTHTQDPKFLPNSTFSASVDFSSSSFSELNGSIEDYITAQTSSSISYTKSWTGKPISLAASLRHTQNNRDSTVELSFPNLSFNVSKVYPFKRKNAIGKQLWYEKIGLSYSGTLDNTINTKQDLLFKDDMFKSMKYGVNHQIPINTSFSILKYLNVTPSVSYQERWYFSKIEKQWDPETSRAIITDTIPGFNRVYNYNAGISLQTILYGMYNIKGDKAIKAVRHMMTPSLGMSYAPDFSDDKFGYYKPIQTDKDGTIGTYSPYEQGIYGVPGRGESASLNFSLANTVEMKIRNKKDTAGVSKVKIFESLNLSSSYNFLADSMNLAPISISARTTLFKSLGINFSATLDPYQYTALGARTKNLALGRITSMSLSFGYSFRSMFGYEGEESGTGSETLPRNLTADENSQLLNNGINPNEAISLLTPEYYNFSIPWNLSFNYILSYNHSGINKKVEQTVSYNGSITFTDKWGFTFSGGINLNTLEITPGSVSIDRDLHCWQMGVTWVPVGFRKSWSFNIRVKSSILQDLKLEKSSGFLDNYY